MWNCSSNLEILVLGSWILWPWPWKCSDFTHILIRDSRCCEHRKECVRILLLVTAFCCKQKIEAVAGRCSIDSVYQKTGAPQLEIPVSDKSACDWYFNGRPRIHEGNKGAACIPWHGKLFALWKLRILIMFNSLLSATIYIIPKNRTNWFFSIGSVLWFWSN